MTQPLKVAVVGAGRMGSDHIIRLRDRMKNVRVTAVIDIDQPKAEAALEGIEGARVYTDFTEALDSGNVDAVMVATPGFLHEQVLLPALSRGFKVFCEKPLTPDSESAWRIVEAEAAMGRKLVQVGFMRRFDEGYRRIRSAVQSGEHGELLALDCEHINPNVPDSYTGRNLIDDTVVHEFDVVRYLTGEEITTVQVRTGKNSSAAKEGLVDPAQVLADTEGGVRVSVNTHVTAGYGYAVSTRATFEKNHLQEGVDHVTPGFEERFVDAYDTEVQEWIDDCLSGELNGPDAWDGYAAAACCEAGLRAIEDPGTSVDVVLNEKPDLYR
ncbi:Gfo/Idh/MocA family protein [Kocuria massiliensis]|uniref:Gfo/Idh/MocA family protein n=1 Tax=Kocuria massiliensis TaxID=1926282 RepID=UPI000A1CAE1C|nr:Gfo/Idh/MocA family oxidoreductase [Kocuria massiliensis]